eukprot:2758496-Rhodomonas_salina.2
MDLLCDVWYSRGVWCYQEKEVAAAEEVAISLRTCYAMSSTGIRRPGTDTAYQTCRLRYCASVSHTSTKK